MLNDLAGVRAVARELSVAPSTISRQLAAGILTNHGTDDHPLISISEARVARAGSLDPGQQRGPMSPLNAAATSSGLNAAVTSTGLNAGATPLGEGADVNDAAPAPRDDDRRPSFQQVRTAREGIRTQIERIELEEKLGNLVDKAEVADAFFDLGRVVREGLEARRGQLAAQLAGMTDIPGSSRCSLTRIVGCSPICRPSFN